MPMLEVPTLAEDLRRAGREADVTSEYLQNVPAFNNLWAVMLFPQDQAERENFHRKCFAKFASDIAMDESSGLDDPFRMTLLRRAKSENAEEFFEAQSARKDLHKRDHEIMMHEGDIVGLLYSIVFAADKNHGLTTGIKAAACIFGSQRRLLDYWSKYRPTAHFWAARRAFPRLTPELLGDFLRYAWSLEQWGKRYIPKHGKHPILDVADCWIVPPRFADGGTPVKVGDLRPEWLAKLS